MRQAVVTLESTWQSEIYSKMRRKRIRPFLMAFVLTLLVLHLLNDFTQEKTICLPNKKEEFFSTTQPTHSYVYSWTKCQKNTSATNITDFNSLPETIKDFLYYRHCRHFPMLLDAPSKCGGAEKSSDVFLLLVIKSSPGNYERREVLRKTWAKERPYKGVWIRRIFISGTSESGSEKVRQNRLLELENQEYNDILQWNFEDTFFNLTLKQILFLEWLEIYCPNVSFLLNGDDDVFANTDNMVEYLQSLRDNGGRKSLFVGHLIQNVGPIRIPGNKYFIPKQVYESESYPPYCGGGGFLLSGYTASVIYNMSQSMSVMSCHVSRTVEMP
ncbi:N-acetyllactosaminide beta-1,3-N-acetylglucosaminyltransferase 3-like isoform X2 [Cynoglossus semilaevis]|uniref:N-acetyllactosaminide beta-1,3-N-acetylglucosaminyltransferase 3-like isoform X1 n=2 Tax=Cynoglossus semilaevis TaxID=244447 RepID=UPI0007DC8CC7|nr:N-acetyllactosaminide beta-1,3-N-acetylglucosaminyltransferase 3-like isoform X1 [Cynoglossus semilaevis]XP_016897048.2 N-acetyllactosaminide beta-1,3-N-acetylglucosaminyltransferase 3-like isoform X2 [Cynoglossus semilaevis]